MEGPDQSDSNDTPPAEKERFGFFTRSAIEIIALVALALFLWKIASALLLLFFGILLAVLLRALAGYLSDYTPIPRGASVIIVTLGIIALVGLGGWLMGAEIAQQANKFSQQLQQFQQQIKQTQWGQYVLNNLPRPLQGQGGASGIFSSITGLASGLANAVTNVILVVFAAIYLAYNPGFYRKGVIKVFPERHRPRVDEALSVSGQALRQWLIATLISMTIVGVLAGVSLKILGVPLALFLGVVAGLLEFVPIFGPFLAAVPALVIGLLQGPMTAVYVGLIYLGIQQLESNVITPLVQKHEASLPPVLTLIAAVGFGMVFGLIGLLVATPLALILYVLVKMLYVEDVLGTPTDVPGRQEEGS